MTSKVEQERRKALVREIAQKRQFLHAHNLPEASVIPWLNKHGGYYDCEVLANVEDGFQQ